MRVSLLYLVWCQLVRHKTRNLVLGSAIVMALMATVVLQSFIVGLSTKLLTHDLARWSGHVAVTMHWPNTRTLPYLPGVDQVRDLVRHTGIGVSSIVENVNCMAEVRSSDRFDTVMVQSHDPDIETWSDYALLKGSFADFNGPDTVNAAIISRDEARVLKVAVGDSVQVRFRTVFGQYDSVLLQVAGIVDPPDRAGRACIWMDVRDLKRLLRYPDYDTQSLAIRLKHSGEADKMAQALMQQLKPAPAVIPAMYTRDGAVFAMAIMGVDPASPTLNLILQDPFLINWLSQPAEGVLIHPDLTMLSGVKPGDKIPGVYAEAFSLKTVTLSMTVRGYYSADFDPGVILMPQGPFMDQWQQAIPVTMNARMQHQLIPTSPIYAGMFTQNFRTRPWPYSDYYHWRGKVLTENSPIPVLDIHTMADVAPEAVRSARHLLWACLIGFCVIVLFIVLGVMVIFRLILMERRCEIGVLRALGARKSAVIGLLVGEMCTLAGLASLTGVGLAVSMVHFLNRITIDPMSPYAIFTLQHHPYLVVNWAMILYNVMIVLAMTGVVTWRMLRPLLQETPSRLWTRADQ